MKKLLTILTLFFCLTSFGQKSDSLVTLKGIVWSVDDNEPIPFAYIYGVHKSNKTKEKLVITNFNGEFKLELNLKKYQDSLITSYLGVETKFHYLKSIKVNIKVDEKTIESLKNIQPCGGIDVINIYDYDTNLVYIGKSAVGREISAEEIEQYYKDSSISHLRCSDPGSIIAKDSKPIKINPHEMSTGITFKDGKYETIK